jgi:hypothetical protein
MEKSQKSAESFNPNKSIPRHIIIELSKIKDKEKVIKASRENKQIS